ncbi:DUF7878 domain-containing protein [Janibacter melonis]
MKRGGPWGKTTVEYLIAIDADLLIYQEGVLLFREEAFPVAELARSLWFWMSEQPDADFIFNSLSYEEEEIICLRQDGSSWSITSSFDPELRVSGIGQDELVRIFRSFIREVHAGLIALGVDPIPVIYNE